MAFLRNFLLSRRSHSLLLNPKTPHTATPHSLNPRSRPISSLPQTQQHPSPPKPRKDQNNKKPLSTLFVEAMGLSEKTATSDKEEEEEEEEGENKLKKNLRQLEEEVKSFKEKTKGVPIPNKGPRRSLYAVFTNQPAASVSVRKQKEENEEKPRELSPDMVVFVQYLFEMGYFKDANFATGKERCDPDWFETQYAWGYIKFAALAFARDNQEIAKWLSGSALKQVAEFGCPSIHKSVVFPAKRLRKFFEVPEETVCSKCMLQQSCKFVNQSVWNCDTNKLDLVIVMKVLISYALQLVHPQLVVPDQVNKSVGQLLKEVVKLSQTT